MDNAALERQIGEKRAELARLQRSIGNAQTVPQHRGVVIGLRIFVLVVGLFFGFYVISSDLTAQAYAAAEARCR